MPNQANEHINDPLFRNPLPEASPPCVTVSSTWSRRLHPYPAPREPGAGTPSAVHTRSYTLSPHSLQSQSLLLQRNTYKRMMQMILRGCIILHYNLIQ